MCATTKKFIQRWLGVLNLTKQTRSSWHRARIREELQERRAAKTPWANLSETSDVLFSMSRARFDGFHIRSPPCMLSPRYAFPYAYMLAKFTLRWGFYRIAAYLSQAPDPNRVREVVNPSKPQKLDEVAVRHGIDPGKFRRVSRRLRIFYPLLP